MEIGLALSLSLMNAMVTSSDVPSDAILDGDGNPILDGDGNAIQGS